MSHERYEFFFCDTCGETTQHRIVRSLAYHNEIAACLPCSAREGQRRIFERNISGDNMKKKHRFMQDRNIKEAFLVTRIDGYSSMPGERGGFTPRQYGGPIQGNLWPEQEKAVGAAQYVLGKQGTDQSAQYGIWKLVAIVEPKEITAPVKVTKV